MSKQDKLTALYMHGSRRINKFIVLKTSLAENRKFSSLKETMIPSDSINIQNEFQNQVFGHFIEIRSLRQYFVSY